MNRAFVIAEPGSTHELSYWKMEDLIQICRDSGADACKFQWTSNVERLCERRNAFDYKAAYQIIAFPPHWLDGLKLECERRGINFLCTVYLPEDIQTIAPYVQDFKISSFEAQDWNFLEAHRAFLFREGRQRLIISTGMIGTDQVTYHRHRCLEAAFPIPDYLHCVSAYPAPIQEMNLSVILELKLAGLSDHSRCEDMGAYAVMAGAKIIEAHVMHPRCSKNNPDYAVSFFPHKFGNYVEKIRRAEKIYGEGEKTVQPSEHGYQRYQVKAS